MLKPWPKRRSEQTNKQNPWWTHWITRATVMPFLGLLLLASLSTPASGPASVRLYNGLHKVPVLSCGPCELRLLVAGLWITLSIWRTWSGFLPSLSEPRPSGRPLLGNRLTSVSRCFSFSFMMHDPGCIFSFHLFGSKKWVGRKCSLESHGWTRRNWYRVEERVGSLGIISKHDIQQIFRKPTGVPHWPPCWDWKTSADSASTLCQTVH